MSNRIKLREIKREDIVSINTWRNDKGVIDYLGTNFFFINENVDTLWFDNYIKNRDKNVRLAIIDIETDKHIGNVYLTSINRVNNSAEFSILIGNKEYWSKGFGKEASSLLLNHGFNDLNIHRIYLTVLSDNERAIRLYSSVGFKIEGVMREAVYKNGSYKDLTLMSVLKEEYHG